MKKSYLTETERMTLKHVLRFGNETIDRFENLNLSDSERSFLIFKMMVGIQQRMQAKIPSKKESRFSRIFK